MNAQLKFSDSDMNELSCLRSNRKTPPKVRASRGEARTKPAIERTRTPTPRDASSDDHYRSLRGNGSGTQHAWARFVSNGGVLQKLA